MTGREIPAQWRRQKYLPRGCHFLVTPLGSCFKRKTLSTEEPKWNCVSAHTVVPCLWLHPRVSRDLSNAFRRSWPQEAAGDCAEVPVNEWGAPLVWKHSSLHSLVLLHIMTALALPSQEQKAHHVVPDTEVSWKDGGGNGWVLRTRRNKCWIQGCFLKCVGQTLRKVHSPVTVFSQKLLSHSLKTICGKHCYSRHLLCSPCVNHRIRCFEELWR